MRAPTPLLLASLVALLTGCKAPPDAPTELAELCNFIYDEAAGPDEDEDLLLAGLANLDAWLQHDIAATAEGYTVDNLDQDIVDSLDIGNPSTEELIGAAVAVEQIHSARGIAIATAWANQQEVIPGNYEVYERDYSGDKDAFINREVLRVEATSYSESKWPLGITVKSTNHIQFRWVETENGWVMIHRSWLTEPADISYDGIKVNAQYYLSVAMPAPWHPDGSIRMATNWIDSDYGILPVPEDYARQQVVKSMIGQGTMIDEWLTEQLSQYGDLDAILAAGS